MNSFPCDVTGCSERFSSETELYKHRKSHTSHPTITTPPPIYPAFTALNPRPATSVIVNGATDLQTPAKSQMTGSAIRKMMESKPERGLYSLKKYENLYKKVATGLHGFKFVCNCGQFETKSQATLVRHIWEHQSSQKTVDNNDNNESNGFENMSQTSNELSAPESIGRRDSGSIDEEADEDGDDEESTDQIDANESQRNLISKETTEESDSKNKSNDQSSAEVTAEEVYLNSLIVEIEDRGYFCQWPECEFSDEQREPVVVHIKQVHNNLDGNTDTSLMQITGDEEELNGGYESENEQQFQESNDPTLNHYCCEYDFCGASFPSFESLEEHKKLHFELTEEENCDDSMDDEMGYSGAESVIKTTKSYSYNGKASAQDAEKYTDQTIMSDGSYLFKCKWDACGYASPIRGQLTESGTDHSLKGLSH